VKTNPGVHLALFFTVVIWASTFSSVNLAGWFNVIYLGFMASALAYLLWNKALATTSTVTAERIYTFCPSSPELLRRYF
jgi:drug/metabolite transporter (DMT)-like permease